MLLLCLWCRLCPLHLWFQLNRLNPLRQFAPFYPLGRCFLCRQLFQFGLFGRLNQ